MNKSNLKEVDMKNAIHETIYHSFERELSRAIEYIYVDDGQQNVYSIRNAALILKIGAEIEAVAKEICEKNKKHNTKHKFDDNCIKDNEHKITSAVIMADNIHFDDIADTVFKPFTKDEKKYDSEQMTYGWNNAYQNIKHGTLDVVKTFGTIKYILRALGTLYTLNYELSGKCIDSKFFAYISGDKIVGRAGGVSWGRMISLTPEQEELVNEES